jgi:hypothetical protein
MAPPRRLAAPTMSAPPHPVAMRDRAGKRMDGILGVDAHAALLIELIHTGRPGFVELAGAPRLPDGKLARFSRHDMKNFVRAGHRGEFLERVRALRAEERREIYFTPATMRVRAPGNDSVDTVALAWIDIDDPRQLGALRRFAHRPHAVVASGSGGVHVYWLLAEELTGERCEALNRMLAARLGADPVSANRGRFLRVPGTLNHKPTSKGRTPTWCRMLMCDLAKVPYSAAALAAGLRDPKAPRPARAARRPSHSAGEEPWKAMEAADYFRAIVGTEQGRDGKVRCPNAGHADEHPSVHIYRGVGRGWYCFSCGVGGGAVDLVAAMHGYPTGRALGGEQYLECVAELRRIFEVEEPRRGTGSP